MSLNRLLADAIAVVHAGYVGFVVFGLLIILIGAVARWKWVRNFWFRALHLVMIGIVVIESLLNITCPLTTWEHQLRTQAGETVEAGSFIGRWAHDLIFFDAAPWVFTTIYCVFGGAVLASFLLIPPSWPPNWPFRRRGQPAGDKTAPQAASTPR